MSRERNGVRKRRDSFPQKVPDLGYYFVVTDTKETERNYLYGLRDALPAELQGRIVIKVSSAKTKELIKACEQATIDPQYRQCWIVFDRDKVVNFDDIISSNKQEQNNYSKPFNKEEWQQKKQAERQELYDLADKTAEEVRTDPVKFKQYLDTQATFNVYSVNNALLIALFLNCCFFLNFL